MLAGSIRAWVQHTRGKEFILSNATSLPAKCISLALAGWSLDELLALLYVRCLCWGLRVGIYHMLSVPVGGAFIKKGELGSFVWKGEQGLGLSLLLSLPVPEQ